MATSEVGIDHIQKQIDNCDDIVANIDKIVPKLYKIRQQALAQKEYVNDIQGKLLSVGLDSVNGTTKIATFVDTTSTNALGTLVSTSYADKAFKNGDNSAEQRCVIQSLFKYKHEVGTSTHFTTEQIGSATDRTNGLHLSDVVQITSSLDTLLSASNTPTAANSSLIDLILKKSGTQDGVVPVVGESNVLVGTAAAPTNLGNNNYASDGDNGLASHLTTALTITGDIVGFGLT